MVLLDSDAARKLIQYLLLLECSAAYEIPLTSVVILPQLKFQLKINDKQKALTILGSEAAYNLLKHLLDQAREAETIPSAVANMVLDLNMSNLDSGEQVLLAILASQGESKLLSGDKRAIIAISGIAFDSDLLELWNRLFCLEEAVLLMLKKGEFENLTTKIRARPDVDNALKIVFGISSASSVSEVEQGLCSYITSLSAATKGLYPVQRSNPI